ncbi:hypothetical protein Scep_019781 [Stephania cephalantha]|uniref:Myb/SANT-like domain-containing protein n=1 Tax=Stephania cephalantha TaxID=152367 RepID=A0AAP0IBX7_9MAGN
MEKAGLQQVTRRGGFQRPRKASTSEPQPLKLLKQSSLAARKGKGKANMPREPGEETKVYRHAWTHTEKATLVHAMYEMVGLGVYKCDNGFKPGYLNHLEEMLKISCPTSGIKAKPHIESKVKVMKKHWSIVNDMNLGIKHGSSGFGFDSNTKKVTAPLDLWDEYLKL